MAAQTSVVYDRPLKRGRTEATFQFSFRSNTPTFPKYHVVHSENNTPVRKLSPFLVAKCLKDKIGPTYKASKMSSGDLLLELNDKDQVQMLSELTSIGDATVTISAHRTLNTSRGVISEEDFLGLSDEELLEGFQEQNVTKVQRIVIRRNDQEIPTKHVILTFGTSEMPTSLNAGYVKVNVRPYIPNPRRCFKCQRFGHASHACRGQTTCAKCSSNEHQSDNCTSSLHCVNCKGDHAAYSRSCPCWKKEKEVIALTVKEKISFYEARKRLSYLSRRSYAEVTQVGAASQRPRESCGPTHSGPAVTPPAPVVEAVSAAPPSSKGPQTPVSQGPKINRAPRPETRVSAPNSRSSSASGRAMEVDSKTPVSSTPKDKRSLERAKRDKVPITTLIKKVVT
ncbi:uncharacterized protein LOC125942457 [Dermacentor silvarum]|uniref:uncharacterized protein LOC125942457 n=1 Tax=Dermacentor silvarum TaxID=543639 RepID=UPI002101C764|nr:uncharacterized protein LOC125942457 [Dermacentor silvarum]